jgi:type II secretory pathway component PulM
MSALESAKEYWSTRSARERTALFVAAAAVVAAALYLLLLGPGLEARAKLSAALPKLRAQLEDMRQQEKEIAQLRKKVGAKPKRADLKPLLQSAIARTAFVNSVVRIDTLTGDKALLVVTPVVFDDWIEWIEQLQREFGIRLDEVRIAALDQPGLVRIEATFAFAGQLASAAPR